MTAAAFALFALAIPAVASAAAPPLFTQIPKDGQSGIGAGRMANPHSIGVHPDTGHIYVAELNNNRVSEFDSWGSFVKAWGWGVLDGSAELQVCTQVTGCREGLAGDGAGQVAQPFGGVAIDSGGNVYVVDRGNHRVQKFDSSGAFLLMFGGGVNETTAADVCTKADLEATQECGAGVVGAGPGEFSEWPEGSFLDIAADDTVYVGDNSRVQAFNPDGTYKSEIPLPEARDTKSLAVDPITGAIYVAVGQDFSKFFPEVPHVFKLDSTTGQVLDEIPVGSPDKFEFELRGTPELVDTDSAGNLYVIAQQQLVSKLPWQEVLEFDSGGSCVQGVCPGDEFSAPDDGTFLLALASGAGCDEPTDTLYVSHFNGSGKSYVQAFGASPDPLVCEPPKVPPDIMEQYAVSVDTDGATVRAEISPEFWPTTYYLEFGTDECSKGGCEQVLAPDASLGQGKGVNFPLRTASVFLGAGQPLQPDTTYHFRFVAQSEGGGPVKGVGGEVGLDGEEGTFTTFPLPESPPSCPNDEFRDGPAVMLPDCRAYEMVSPVDKDNGDASLLGDNARSQQHNQSSIDGQRLTYSSYQPFSNPKGAPTISQYLATRDPREGWSTENLSMPRGIRLIASLRTLHTEYGAFSPDLCDGWLRHDTDHPPFDSVAIPGYSNLYRRESCNGGPLTGVTRVEPPIGAPNSSTEKFVPELQGVSADGSCTVFRANARLTEDASAAVDSEGNGVHQVYENCNGDLRLISVLPGGSPCALGASAGTVSPGAASSLEGRANSVAGAVSDSGSQVYWSCGGNAATPPSGTGALYLRSDNPQEADDEVTFQLSSANVQFWAGASDGSRALFTNGDELREYTFAGTSTLLAKGVKGVLGASNDISRAYFVSTEKLSTEATAGQLNLYLREGGTFTFIAALSSTDIGNLPFSATTPIPFERATRVTPDGLHLAFMSSDAELSERVAGYDNADVDTGEPNAEVYLYDAVAGELVCISCNPTGARPRGREFNKGSSKMRVAAKLPTWVAQLHAERALSEDGSRLYFESYEALALRDTNGGQDVYQWEAEGSGDCDQNDAAFNERSGGCVSLISSGKSIQDSEFIDATPNGSDVFLATAASLLPQDPSLIDIYDARTGGGFPPPAPPVPPCEGEACQSPPAPPNDPTPASAAMTSPVNGKEKGRCPKGKHRVKRQGKAKCVKNKKRQGARQRGRAGR